MEKQFALKEEELESIFDIIEKEFPDLRNVMTNVRKTTKPVAIVENYLQSKIAVLTHSITKPLSSLPI